VGDGTTDDLAAFTAAFAAANSGDTVLMTAGKTYKVTNSLIVPEGVIFDGQDSTLNMYLSGNVLGVDMSSHTTIQHITVNVISATPASGPGNWQATINIGDYIYGSDVHNINVLDVTASTQRNDMTGAGIDIFGSAHDVYIDGYTYPDNNYRTTPFRVHWGNFDNPSAGTTHAYNLTLKNMVVGTINDTYGAIYLSSCYNFTIENITVKSCNTGIIGIVGDYGFYYAPIAIRSAGMYGSINNVTITKANTTGVTVQGITTLAPGTPDYRIAITFNDLDTTGGGALGGSGADLIHTDGTSFYNCHVTNHVRGVIMDGTSNTNIVGGNYSLNHREGILSLIANHINSNVLIDGNTVYGNGIAATGQYGIVIGNGSNVTIKNNIVGKAGESTQKYGIDITSGNTGIAIIDNNIISVSGGGIAYVVGTATSYGVLKTFNNNSIGAGITHYSGANIITTSTDPDNTRNCIGTAAPLSGDWITGDTVYNNALSADKYNYTGQNTGWICTASGAPGTWASFGVDDTTENLLLYYNWVNDIGNTTAIDATGNGHNGSIVNATRYKLPSDKYYRNFYGGSSVITVSHDDQFNTGASVTIGVWFKTIKAQTSEALYQYDTSAYKYLLYLTTDSKKLQFNIVTASGTSVSDYTLPSGSFADGEWHNVFAVYNRYDPETKRLKLYVDGTEVDTTEGYNENITTSAAGTVSIGKFNANYLNASLANIRLYSDAKTPGEIASILAYDAAMLNVPSYTITASQTTITESNTSITLTVTKSMINQYPFNVTISTIDGTATAGNEYSVINQVLTFAPGETIKTVALSIKDDGHVNSAIKTFTVALSNPTGNATLGTPSSVTIQITPVLKGEPDQAIRAGNMNLLLVVMLGVFVILYSLGSLLIALKTGFDTKIFLLIISGGIILGITLISFVVLTYLNGEMYNAIAAFNL
jgi:hypothetical protein